MWASQTLAELIEQKFTEEESFMVQISMGETFEKIRSGEFVALAASEESKDPEESEKLAK